MIQEIKRTLTYMAGPLQKLEPHGGPKYDETLRVGEIVFRDGAWQANYSYDGTFIVDKDNYRNLKIYLPYDYREIYKQAKNANATNVLAENPCVDSEYLPYMDFDHFWYFWNPFKKGSSRRGDCKLQAGVHYEVITPHVEIINNFVRQSYPEYEKLPKNGNIEMLLVIGANEDANGFLKPDRSNDDANVDTYKNMVRYLERKGFTQTVWTDADYRSICQTNQSTTQTISDFTKRIGQHNYRIRLFWGTTSVRDESYPFYCVLSHGLANASLIQYNAHSGMGSSVYLQQLRNRLHQFPFRMNPDQYQILVFNGCSSYGYYNDMFFREKRRSQQQAARVSQNAYLQPSDQIYRETKNLDMITNGLVAYFHNLTKMTTPIMDAVFAWSETGRRTSYQDIVDDMEPSPTALTNVTGEEDNRP